MIIVATTSLPVVDRPNADRWNAARGANIEIQEKEKLHQVENEDNTSKNEIIMVFLAYATCRHFKVNTILAILS